MNAFRIIEMVEGKESAEAFKEYIDGLDLKDEVREKITGFDLTHPLYQYGFHPALILHMMEFNKICTQ